MQPRRKRKQKTGKKRTNHKNDFMFQPKGTRWIRFFLCFYPPRPAPSLSRFIPPPASISLSLTFICLILTFWVYHSYWMPNKMTKEWPEFIHNGRRHKKKERNRDGWKRTCSVYFHSLRILLHERYPWLWPVVPVNEKRIHLKEFQAGQLVSTDLHRTPTTSMGGKILQAN